MREYEQTICDFILRHAHPLSASEIRIGTGYSAGSVFHALNTLLALKLIGPHKRSGFKYQCYGSPDKDVVEPSQLVDSHPLSEAWMNPIFMPGGNKRTILGIIHNES